jgi:uncharacterized protein (DUF1800 family)
MNVLKAAVLATLMAIGMAVVAHPGLLRAAAPPSDDQALLHVLNRVAFGPRPGEVGRVRTIGIAAYIEQQLHPERIPDPAVPARLASLRTLTMSSRSLADQFERPAIEARRAKQKDAPQDQPPAGTPPDAVQQRANTVVVELSEQKILRAVYSERQLQEVLTDFWFNHFNVDARKGPARFMLTEYERETIRPNVFGKFRDLLEADAKSPAMLFYLDNWMSVDPNGPHLPPTPPRIVRGPFGPTLMPGFPRAPAPQNPNAPRGLNENYARELMELHTLGVDGGYTQQDVTEVARAFTGWTIDRPRQGGGFLFNPRQHDDGQKIVLGHVIRAGGGAQDGDQVLDILGEHQSTASFIATKLVRHFVSDAPPAALVDRVAAKFRATHGDLREVYRAILTSPEFLSADAYGAKVKTPFEFLVSAVRATGAEVHDARPLVKTMQQLGMPLYQCQPPTGYKDTADAWANSGEIVNRMNVGLALASNRLPGTFIGSIDAPDDAFGIADGLKSIPFKFSETTLATMARATTTPQTVALTIGSPEFQRR